MNINKLKIFTLFFMCLLMLIFVTSCSKTENQKLPTADFIFSPNNGYKPLTVSFTNISENSESYFWDFGNGDFSTAVNPSTTYVNDGVYSITLTAKNSAGTNKITKTITIKTPPKSVSIMDISILNFPETDDLGNNWDNSFSGSYPDVYFKITDATSSLFTLNTTDRFENLRKFDLPKTFVAPTNGFYTFTDLNSNFGISLYDYESIGSDQFMGGVLRNSTFKKLYEDGNLPSSITLTYGSYSFEVSLKWNL